MLPTSSTYPGITAVQDLIGGSPGGTAGHTGVQPVANLSAAAIKQQFSLPFLQTLGQATVVASSPSGAQLSSLTELCVPAFPQVRRDGQDEHELQMLHGFKNIYKQTHKRGGGRGKNVSLFQNANIPL